MAIQQTEEKIVFSADLMSFINEWQDKRGSLIMILHRLQQEYRYLPTEVLLKLSEVISVPLAKIFGVVTFYHYFKQTKPGKHKIAVCMGTACYLKGAGDLINEFGNLMDVKVDETTEDGQFTLESVRCVGCCGLAPVVMVDDEVYGKLVPDSLPGIVAEYRQNSSEGAE